MGQVHGISHVVVLSLLERFLDGELTAKKNGWLHIDVSDHGKDFPYIQQKLPIGNSKQTVKIVKIRMKVLKEPAVKMERKSKCKSYYKEHCTASTIFLPPNSFQAFYLIQFKQNP